MRVPIALLITSLVLGVAYYAYLVQVAFPPPAARAVPFLWLALSAVACWRSFSLVRQSRRDFAAMATLALSMLSALVAVPFVIAASFGD